MKQQLVRVKTIPKTALPGLSSTLKRSFWEIRLVLKEGNIHSDTIFLDRGS